MEQLLIRQAYINKRPISATLELLPLCNLNCDMCYVRLSKKEMDQQGSLLPYTKWIELAKQMQEMGILFLLITGGEPLLFPHFKELYAELKKMGFIITINTNGTLFNQHWIDFFLKYKPRRINITLYGSNNDTYKKLCHYPNGFTDTMHTIKDLIKHQLPLKINGSIVKDNVDELQELYDICLQHNVPIHVDTYMIPSLSSPLLKKQAMIRLSPEEMAQAELITLKNELTEEAFTAYIQQTIQKLEATPTYPNGISCQAANTSFAINWKGDMSPCISMKGLTISVLDHSLEEAWEFLYKESKKLMMDSKCATCQYRPICKTCVATAQLETSHYNKAPSYLCAYSEAYAKPLYDEYNKISPQRD